MRGVVQRRISQEWDPRGIDKPFQPSPVQGRRQYHHVDLSLVLVIGAVSDGRLICQNIWVVFFCAHL